MTNKMFKRVFSAKVYITLGVLLAFVLSGLSLSNLSYARENFLHENGYGVIKEQKPAFSYRPWFKKGHNKPLFKEDNPDDDKSSPAQVPAPNQSPALSPTPQPPSDGSDQQNLTTAIDPNANVNERIGAIENLGIAVEQGNQAVIAGLAGLILTAPSQAFRSAVLDALGPAIEQGSQRVIDNIFTLIGQLSDDGPDEYSSYEREIRELFNYLAPAIEQQNEYVVTEIGKLAKWSNSDVVQKEAIRALKPALEQGNPTASNDVAYVALHDPDEGNRTIADIYLGYAAKAGNTRAINTLSHIAVTDGSYSTTERLMALDSLGPLFSGETKQFITREALNAALEALLYNAGLDNASLSTKAIGYLEPLVKRGDPQVVKNLLGNLEKAVSALDRYASNPDVYNDFKKKAEEIMKVLGQAVEVNQEVMDTLLDISAYNRGGLGNTATLILSQVLGPVMDEPYIGPYVPEYVPEF